MGRPTADDERQALSRIAQTSGHAVIISPEQRRYYEAAELAMDFQWENLIWPFLKGLDFTCVLDLAAGYGRNSAKLLKHANRLIVVDINQECIEYCKQRFKGIDKVVCLQNDGFSLGEVEDNSITLVYTFDSMVHFDSDVVKEYLKEFYRVLKPEGHCFCHHSNYVGNPEGDLDRSPHRRNFMSKELFAHYSLKAGLQIVEQKVIDWGDYPGLDCFTLLTKPVRKR